MFSFDGKIVVVTGGEKGIGKATAKAFAENGAKVVIVGTDAEAGQKTAAELNGNATFVQTDVSNLSQVAQLPDKIKAIYGLTDILVNNAGIIIKGNLTDISVDEWDKVMNINVRGVYLTTKYLISHMLEKKKGVIVNIGSEAGISAFKNQIVYNVSKAAVIHFTKCIAVDYAKDNIRANVVCPGTTYTPLVEQLIKDSDDPKKAREGMEVIRPLGRLGTAEEIANAVLCMASEELAYATGSVLSIDGGYVIQ